MRFKIKSSRNSNIYYIDGNIFFFVEFIQLIIVIVICDFQDFINFMTRYNIQIKKKMIFELISFLKEICLIIFYRTIRFLAEYKKYIFSQQLAYDKIGNKFIRSPLYLY